MPQKRRQKAREREVAERDTWGKPTELREGATWQDQREHDWL